MQLMLDKIFLQWIQQWLRQKKSKVMAYNGYPRSKFYFNFLNINSFNCFFVTSSVGLKEVSHSLKNGWFAHYRCLQ